MDAMLLLILELCCCMILIFVYIYVVCLLLDLWGCPHVAWSWVVIVHVSIGVCFLCGRFVVCCG